MAKKDKTQVETGGEAADAAELKQKELDDKISKADIVSFKKVVRGYNPDEVDEYIDLLNANLAGAQQVFEARSAEMKDSITFVSRERDQLKADKAEMAEKAAAYDQKCAELKAASEELETVKDRNAQLAEKVGIADPKFAEDLIEENKQLKAKIEAVNSELAAAEKKKNDLTDETAGLTEANTKLANEIIKVRDENKKQTSEINALNEANTKLSNEFTALKGTIKKQENQIAGLKAENKEQEVAFAEFRAAKTKQANELTSMKDNAARQANEIAQLRESASKQADEYKGQKKEIEELYAKEQLRLSGEIREYKLKIADLESGLKSEELNRTKLTDEIAGLREENSKQAYDFAGQKKEIEMQIQVERLNRSELLQVLDYNIRKSEELLGEVSKQITQSKESLSRLNSKK